MRSINNDYDFFCDEIANIEEFRMLSNLSYALASEMLKQSSAEKLKSLKKKLAVDIKSLSYSIADRELEEMVLSCEWIDQDEYSKRYNLTLENIKKMHLNQELGYTITKDDNLYIIWPKEKQTNIIEKLPPLEKKMFTAKVKQKGYGGISIEEGENQSILALMGKKKKTIDLLENKAENMLNEKCFLSIWSSFELFIKNIIYTLIEIKPENVFENKKIGKQTISYNEIFEASNNFADINSLKQYIVDTIINNQDENHNSIHELINFIKKYFMKGKEPYITWYIYEGIKFDTSYKSLMDIKEIRNSLIHDKGDTNPEFWNKIDFFEKTLDGILVIDDHMYNKCTLVLKSIAYNIKIIIEKENLIIE